jgi:hypothetical protein
MRTFGESSVALVSSALRASTSEQNLTKFDQVHMPDKSWCCIGRVHQQKNEGNFVSTFAATLVYIWLRHGNDCEHTELSIRSGTGQVPVLPGSVMAGFE